MSTVLKLPRLRIERLPLLVHGTAPLIIHHWSDRRAITAQTTGDAMFEAARLRDAEGRDGVFASYFQRALVDVAKLTKTVVRGALSVAGVTSRLGGTTPLDAVGGDLLPLTYDELERREDVVTLAAGERTYVRPAYHGWKVELPLDVNTRVLSADDVVELVDAAGAHIGVGRRRPQDNGSFGTFTVFG